MLRPHRVGVGAYVDDGTALRLAERVELDVTAEPAPRCPRGWPATCCCPTTATSPSPRLRLDDRVAAPPPWRPSAGSRTRWPGRWCTPRCGTPCATASCRRPRTSAPCCGRSARRATPRRWRRCSTQARTAATRFTADGAGLLADLHEHSAAAARALPAGDDLQLVHVRAAVSAAADGDGAARLARRRRRCPRASRSTPTCAGTSSCGSRRSARSTPDRVAQERERDRTAAGRAGGRERAGGAARPGGQGGGLGRAARRRRAVQRAGPLAGRRLLAGRPGRAAAPVRRRGTPAEVAGPVGAAQRAAGDDARRAAVPAHPRRAAGAGGHRRAHGAGAPGRAAAHGARAARRARARRCAPGGLTAAG